MLLLQFWTDYRMIKLFQEYKCWIDKRIRDIRQYCVIIYNNTMIGSKVRRMILVYYWKHMDWNPLNVSSASYSLCVHRTNTQRSDRGVATSVAEVTTHH